MGYNFNLAENCHIVNIIPATTSGGAADLVGDYINTKLYQHVDFIISFGSTAATSTVIIYESDDNAGSTTSAIAVPYYSETTSAGDTLGTRTTGSTSGIATSVNDRIFYVFSLDTDTLSAGYPYVSLHCNVSGANSVSAVAVMSGARYSGQTTPTAIT